MAKRTALILGCALLLASAASAQKTKAPPTPKPWAAEPTTFFGLPLGQPIKQTDIADCGMSSAQANPEITVCIKRWSKNLFSIAGFPIKEFESGYLFLDEDNNVTSVIAYANHGSYRTVKGLLVDRYGPPTTVEAGTSQNAMGAKFSNETLNWVGPKIRMELKERDEKIDQSSVTVSHKETFGRMLEADSKKRRSDAAKF